MSHRIDVHRCTIDFLHQKMASQKFNVLNLPRRPVGMPELNKKNKKKSGKSN